MTVRCPRFILAALCAAVSSAWGQNGCEAAGPSSGPSWQEVRESLEQRVLEAPKMAQARLALAQYLTYCDGSRREGILQLQQLARDPAVGAAALQSWRQALAWVASDETSVPLYRAFLRLQPHDRTIKAQLATLESGGLLPGNRSGAPAPFVSAVAQAAVQRGPALADTAPSAPSVPAVQPWVSPAQAAPGRSAQVAVATAPARPASGWSAATAPSESSLVPGAGAPQAKAAPGSVQAQLADLRADIRDIEQNRSSEFSIGTQVRSRQGEAGMSQLTATEVPMELKLAAGDGKLALRLVPVVLSAGTPATSYDVLSRFGAGPVSALADPVRGAGSQNDAGLGIGVAYEARHWQADIGTTPLGFGKSDVSAGIRLRQPLGKALALDLGLSRRPVRDSVLSFAGARDQRSGVVWGGVSASGGRAGLTWDNGDIGIYGYGGLHRLTGTYVESNTRAEAGIGLYRHFLRDDDQQLTAGVALTALRYDKNLRYFTFGHGGYFSPQGFVSVGLPVEWQQRVGRLRYHLKGSIGLQYIREDDAPYFPGSASRQAAAAQAAADADATGVGAMNQLAVYSGQRKTGLGYGFSGAVEYQLQPQLWLGGHLGFDNARDYRQVAGGVYLRYAFEPFDRPLPLPLSPMRSLYDYD